MSEFDNRFNEALNGLLKSMVGLEKTHRRMKSFNDLVQQQADIDESKSIEDLSGSCKEEILKGHAGLCRHRWQLLRDLRIHRPLTDLEKLAVNTASSVARKNGACADVLGLFLESRGHLDEARDMFKQGADLGNASAALDAGRLYMDGPMRDLAKASRYLKRAAKRADVARLAQHLLGEVRSKLEISKQRSHEQANASSRDDVFNTCVEEALDASENRTELQKALVSEALSYVMDNSLDHKESYSNSLMPGLPCDHLAGMETYVAAHPNSYSGRSVLYSLRHYIQALLYAVNDNYESGFVHLFFAFLYDEKPISRTCHVSRDGRVVWAPILQGLFDVAESRLKADPEDLVALVMSSWAVIPGKDSNFSLRHGYLDTAVRVAERLDSPSLFKRILPKLLNMRGCYAANRRQFDVAIIDFVRAALIFRKDSHTSMWPNDPDDVADPGTAHWKIMLATLEVDVGRAALYIKHPDASLARCKLRRFIDTVPKDTHYFEDAHYELSRAILGQLTQVTNVDMDAVLRDAELTLEAASTASRLPIFRTASNLGMIAGAKQEFKMAKLMRQLKSKGNDSSRHRPSVELGSKCWCCNCHFVKLYSCAGCKVAQYCSPQCQKQHWKVHKEACRRSGDAPE